MADSSSLFEKIKDGPSFKTRRSNIAYKIVLSIITIAICSYYFIIRVDEVENTKSKPTLGPSWYGEDIIADYSFPILRKKNEYLNDLNASEKNSRKVFVLNPFEQQNSLNRVDRYFQDLQEDSSLKQISVSNIYSKFRSIVNKVYAAGFIDKDLSDLDNSEIILELANGERVYYKTTAIFDINKVRVLFKNELPNLTLINRDFDIIERDLINLFKSNFEYSEKLTLENISRNKKSVPKTNGFVNKGENIISHKEKVTEEKIRILESYYDYGYQLEVEEDKFLISLGSAGHLILILSFLLVYVFRIREEEYFDNLKFTILNLMIILITILAWYSLSLDLSYPFEYLIFLPGISILAAIIFDPRSAFYLTVTLSLIIAGLRGNDYTMSIIMMFAGFMAIFSVRDIQSRSQLFKSIFFIFIGFSLPIVFFNLESNSGFKELLTRLGFVGINAAISPLIAFGLLFIIEKFTYINTNLSLREYDNLNHPLLQQLNELAPGTYQHSLGVSALAEKCAGALGLNTLFCKVAPYYHDIGKMEKPEYFAENQIGIENKHNLISPFQSSEIIISHVTAGITMAKKNKLPRSIIDIISNHHGTTIIQHFYAKAVELSKTGEIDKSKFTYPGPKPNSKEAAIIMLCDQVEAISRLDNKTKAEINQMIDEIAQHMIEQNQFDQCDITTNEISIIKEILKKQVSGMTHKRVDYKKIESK